MAVEFQDIMECFGTKRKASDALGVTYQAVQHWQKKGVPRGIQFEMEVLSKGKLKADRGHQGK